MTVRDRLAAYQFDAAVVLLGSIVENAAQELHDTGTKQAPKWEAKYSMPQLLDPDFRLPALPRVSAKKSTDGIAALKAMASTGGVKVFKAKGDTHA